MPRPLRSVLAVLAGLVAIQAIAILCNLLALHAMRLKSAAPAPGYLVLNLLWSLTACAAGGWITARLSGFKPVHHGLALAMLVGLLGMASLMRPSPSQPYGYQFLLAILQAFAVLAGAALAARRTSAPGSAAADS